MAKTTRQRPTKKRPRPRPIKKKVAKASGKARRARSTIQRMSSDAKALVIYGPPGVGKTALAANFPKPGFVIDSQEEGIHTLVEYEQAPKPIFVEEAADFEATIDLAEQIARGEYGIETAVFDSLTGFEKLCFIHHCDEYFEGDWSSRGFYSFQQGPKNAAKIDWPRFLEALKGIKAAGINVLLIAHSWIKPYHNPEAADYDRFSPAVDKAIWEITSRWATGVFFYNFHVDIDKKGPRNKANMESETRFLYTEWSPAFDAKNQYGMEPLVDVGDNGAEAYDALAKVFAKAAKNKPI